MRGTLAGWVAWSVLAAMTFHGAAADEPAAEKTAATADAEEFKPPDGWRARKRGKFTVYCRKDYNAKGTRFPQETCYDEEGIRAMLVKQQEDRDNLDQMRRICGQDGGCAR